MANIFSFTRSSAAIEPMGVIELRFSQWSHLDAPVDICLYETDIRAFERRTRFGSVSERTSGPAGTYLGKISCSRITGNRTRLYCETPTQVDDAADTVRPIPFRVCVPSGSATDDTREFCFRVRGEEETHFEILVQIVDHDSGDLLAPTGNTSMVAGLRGIVMPRFLQIVQPYFRADWQPPEPGSESVSQAMVDECISYIRSGIDDATWQVPAVMGEALYRSAVGGSDEPWIRDVVEHLTGSPYKRSQLAYGGGGSGWRDHLRTTGHYPVCNVCDQLSSVIQWRRGVEERYVDLGIPAHKNHYRDSGAVLYESYDEALSNVTEWARSGATIFLESNPPGRDTGASSPRHETTILRAKGSGDSLKVQLFDYGGNLSGPGAMRGYVGTLAPVAQESGWIAPAHAIGLLGQERFMAVGWRPYRDDAARRLQDPIGNVTLVLTQVDGGSELRRLTHSDLHGSSGAAGPQTILPLTHYLCALSGMPHADSIKASFQIESVLAFSPGGSVTALVDIETDASGSVQATSRTRDNTG
jgi:hypothetical protein